jgi:hypothetical protein
MLVINDYIKINSEVLEDWHIILIRFIQASIIVGMVFLYKYMLNGRKKFIKGTESNDSKESVSAL